MQSRTTDFWKFPFPALCTGIKKPHSSVQQESTSLPAILPKIRRIDWRSLISFIDRDLKQLSYNFMHIDFRKKKPNKCDEVNLAHSREQPSFLYWGTRTIPGSGKCISVSWAGRECHIYHINTMATKKILHITGQKLHFILVLSWHWGGPVPSTIELDVSVRNETV